MNKPQAEGKVNSRLYSRSEVDFVLDLWVQLMKNGIKNKSVVILFIVYVQYIYIYIYIYIYYVKKIC